MTEAEKIRDHYRQKALHDEASQKEQAFEEGLEKGIEQGLEKGIEIGRNEGKEEGIRLGEQQTKLANARNLLRLLDDQAIAGAVDLPVEVVRQLRQEAK